MAERTPAEILRGAMSEENVETVRRFYEALERAVIAYWNPRSIADALSDDDLDPDAMATFGLLAPDIVWSAGPFGTYQGRVAMASAWDDLLEVADDYRLSVRELHDCADGRVFTAIDRTIKATASGIHTTIPVFAVIAVRDGLIAAIDEYVDRAEALEAAGLRE